MKNKSFSSTGFGKFLIFILSMSFKINLFFNQFRKPRWNNIEVKRMENCFDDFPDLVGKLCKVLKIEKYSDGGPWILSFSCEGRDYSIRLVEKYFTENKKLILKSKKFKFVKSRYCIRVEPVDKEAYRRSRTSMEVWGIDFTKKSSVNYGYLSL